MIHKLLLCMTLLIPAHAFGDALEQLNAFFGLTTFKASFIQEVYDNQKNLVEGSEGTVAFYRPGQFIWQYSEPEPYIIATDGIHFIAYDPNFAQAYIRPTMEALGTAPLMVLLNRRDAFRDFYTDLVKRKDKLEWVRLTPKVDDTEFTHFEVGFSKHGIKRMTLFDRFEQRIEIQFLGVQVNVPLLKSQFQLKLPKGTDIIGNPLH